MSVYSDYRSGAINEQEFNDICVYEARKDKAQAEREEEEFLMQLTLDKDVKRMKEIAIEAVYTACDKCGLNDCDICPVTAMVDLVKDWR